MAPCPFRRLISLPVERLMNANRQSCPIEFQHGQRLNDPMTTRDADRLGVDRGARWWVVGLAWWTPATGVQAARSSMGRARRGTLREGVGLPVCVCVSCWLCVSFFWPQCACFCALHRLLPLCSSASHPAHRLSFLPAAAPPTPKRSWPTDHQQDTNHLPPTRFTYN